MSSSAFVPGHITGFFSTHPDENPRIAGSRGAGIALSDGVHVTVAIADETEIRLNGERVSIAAVDGVLDQFGVMAQIEAETPLPVSAGFGVSGATALGTALAVNDAIGTADAVNDAPRTENELVGIAHAAEVTAGTGLGDVVGQARGGIPIRIKPGAPPYGVFDGLPARPRVEYLTFGELDTAAVLGGETDRLSRAGEEALTELRELPTLSTFMAESRRFAEAADLLEARVERTIEDVREVGGEAAMAMLGETVFAIGDGLSAAGYDPSVCHVAGGASLRSDDRQR